MNIVSYSGGKDSTAMLIKMIEDDVKIDEVIFIDLGKEFLEIELEINKMEKYLRNKLNIGITKLKLDRSFDYYQLKHKKRNGKKGYGWCGGVARWGTSLKQRLFNKYIKKKYGYDKVVNFEGIAFDEPDRIDKNNKSLNIRKLSKRYEDGEFNKKLSMERKSN